MDLLLAIEIYYKKILKICSVFKTRKLKKKIVNSVKSNIV